MAQSEVEAEQIAFCREMLVLALQCLEEVELSNVSAHVDMALKALEQEKVLLRRNARAFSSQTEVPRLH
ncbi:hypothetical protein [Novosphingobium sp.]|uniref:hypothetical protein n=1 Tax=Novosphingobium sp. TaxID=1874826 RepID=UPI00262F2B99|nr:hypothetical protein [Novosphingobium sp.]